MATKLWKFVKQWLSIETLNSGADSTQAALELAEKLKEEGPNIEQIKPLLGQISTLLDLLNLPLIQVVGASLPFVPLATGLLKLYLTKNTPAPTFEQCILIVTQVAYLKSLEEILKLPVNKDVLEIIGNVSVSQDIENQIKQLGDLDVDEEAIEEVVICFHKSPLAEKFNQVVEARFKQAGLQAEVAKTLTERISCNTHRHISKIWGKWPDQENPLPKISFEEWKKNWTKYKAIDDYLINNIERKVTETIYDEDFALKDIFVYPNVKHLNPTGQPDMAAHIDLKDWVIDMLYKSDKVIFIQGEPGRGKSVFCQMFAHWVREELHPVWTPILIRLREIKTLGHSFRKTLNQHLEHLSFVLDNPHWLNDKENQFLFLLDGIGELKIQGQATDGLNSFIEQVEEFHTKYSKQGHRVLITGRPLALKGIERLMPNVERVEIRPMDSLIQDEWFTKWSNTPHVGEAESSELRKLLQKPDYSTTIKELAKEPLFLYILARMHRDKQLNTEMFRETDII
ncbi:MAG: NACHT domain-containing protein, partial [Phormidium sp.]